MDGASENTSTIDGANTKVSTSGTKRIINVEFKVLKSFEPFNTKNKHNEVAQVKKGMYGFFLNYAHFYPNLNNEYR